jgi:hypothetical protein
VSPRATLVELVLGGRRAPWTAFGLPADGVVGGVRLAFADDEPPGVRGWALRDLRATALDGLPTARAAAGDADAAPDGPGAPGGPLLAVDHVVALTDDLERTVAALRAAGLDHRRTAGPAAFLVVGPALLEVVQRAEAPPGRATFWGITFVVADPDTPREHVGPARAAVQPGRRIATVGPGAGLGLPVALISPRR